MAAGKYNFTIEQGTTWDQYVNVKDANSVSIDISYYTASMQIRNTYGGTKYADVSCSITVTSGSTVSGSVRMELNSDDTSRLTFGTAYYDVEIASGSTTAPYTTRLLQGQIKLSKEVTT